MGNPKYSKPDNILSESFDQFTLCYVKSTGETHILDAFPSEILDILEAAPADSAGIASALCSRAGGALEDWLEPTQRTLEELQQISLVHNNSA